MPGFFSGQSLEENAIEKARLGRVARNLPIVDLTESNPTRCGYLFPADRLRPAALRYLDSRRYAPDARGLPEARRAICAYYAGRGLEFSAEQIFITAGSSESYRLLFSLLCDPGDNLLAPNVTYPLFDLFAEDRGVALKPYLLDEGRGWAIEGRSLSDAGDRRTRGILIVSPHNPTGWVMEQAISQLDALGLPLIADEVFCEFTHTGRSAPPLGALHPGLPVFHLNGISKMFALPDLKLGWIALNRPACEMWGERLELLNDAYLSAGYMVQAMLPDIFAELDGFTRQMARSLRAKVGLVRDFLGSIPGVSLQPTGGGACVFAGVREEADEESLVLQLLDDGVLVHPGYFYGAEQGVHLMISCLPPESELRGALETIRRRLEKQPRAS